MDMVKITAPGNGFIVEVGYRNGVLTSFETHSPLDTRETRQGEYVAYYLTKNGWQDWGWWNAWDCKDFEPDTIVEVRLDGGGYGKTWSVPRRWASSQPKPDWMFRHIVRDDPTFVAKACA